MRGRSASDTAHAVPAARAVPSRSRAARDPAFPGTGALLPAALLLAAACASAPGAAPLAPFALGPAGSLAILAAALVPAGRLAAVRSRVPAAPGRRFTCARSARHG